MLTRKHLAVLRAALQFFDEELGPHGVEAMRPYFDETLTGELTSSEIRDLRKYLTDCELRYAGYTPTSCRLTSPELSKSAVNILSTTAIPDCRVVTVILPPTD